MSRALWIVGEVLAGVMLSGVVAGIVVPLGMRAGWAPGPWFIWPCVAGSVIVCLVAGERLRSRAHKT